jgi:hypothetical protein
MSTTSETVISKLVLKTGPLEGIDSAGLDEFLRNIPAGLFESVGVIAPVPVRLPDDAMAPNTATLEFNDRVLDKITLVPGVNPVGIIGSLEQNAAELVVPELVDFLLVKLRSRLPALVDTALATSTTETIITTLRSRLQNGESIKNLAGILEDMLAESVS